MAFVVQNALKPYASADDFGFGRSLLSLSGRLHQTVALAFHLQIGLTRDAEEFDGSGLSVFAALEQPIGGDIVFRAEEKQSDITDACNGCLTPVDFGGVEGEAFALRKQVLVVG